MVEDLKPPSSLSPSLQRALQQAIALHDQGHAGMAEGVYRRVLDRHPTCGEVRHLLAIALLEQDRLAEAAVEAEQVVALAQRCGVALLQGAALNTLGNIRVQQEQYQSALSAFVAASHCDPTSVDALYNQGRLQLLLALFPQAIESLRGVLSLCPGHPNAVNALGAALIKHGQFRDAIAHYQTALAQGTPLTFIGTNLASAQEMAGQLDAAEATLQAVSAVMPEKAEQATWLIVRSRLARRRRDLVAALSWGEQAVRAAEGEQDCISALFQKALILDAMGQNQGAFDAFAEANTRVAKLQKVHGYQAEEFPEEVDRARAWFTPERLQKLAEKGLACAGDASESGGESQGKTLGENLVFFVGFPRSGTTLMEQILYAHPRVVTTLEASPLGPIYAGLKATYPQGLLDLDRSSIEILRDQFFTQAEDIVGSLHGMILVDKMPLNMVYFGLIQLLFPRAKILVALRDPRDCVLSCFMQNFQTNSATLSFTDLEQTAQAYDKVMSLWMDQRAFLTLPTHVYRYEDLVDDFATVVEGVLEFIGLDWDPAITHYRDLAADRDIATPSYREVTNPLSRKAIGRWKLYAEPMAAVLPVLAPWVTRLGYQD